MFLGGDLENNTTIHSPGTIHQVRWLAWAIYYLKIFLFRNHYNITVSLKKSIGEILFLSLYFMLKLWFTCPLPTKAPNQDLQFIKDFKLFEAVDKDIS